LQLWLHRQLTDQHAGRPNSALIARAGYDALEIGCAAPIAWPAHLSKTRRAEMRKMINGERLAVSSLLPAPGGG
jgi:protein FrlC